MEQRRYFTALVRRWWLILLLLLLGPGLFYGYSLLQTPVYQATATIVVGQSIQSTQLNQQTIQLSQMLALTYSDLARRQPVLEAAIADLGQTGNWQALRDRIDVRQIEGTQLLEIDVEASSLDEARRLADAIVAQLILQSPTASQNEQQSEKQQAVLGRMQSLEERIKRSQSQVAALEEAIVASTTAQDVQKYQQEITKLEQTITRWEQDYDRLIPQLETGQAANFLSVVEMAHGPTSPIRPRTRLLLILGGTLGLLLGVGLVLLLESLDDTFKSADDLREALALAPLGAISKIKGKQEQQLVDRMDAFDPVVEAYRMIRSNLQFTSVDDPARLLMVTSSVPGEGKSTTAANLAIVMAQAGLKTIIVDADMRRPMQQFIFQVSNLGGLTALLRTPAMDPVEQVVETQVDNLWLLPCGELPPNPAELLGSKRMAMILRDLGERADVVICDSPPTLLVTDAVVLSSNVDGVLLVIKAGDTRRDVVRQALDSLERTGATILGGVLNQVSRKTGGYYAGYYAAVTKTSTQPARRAAEPTTPLRSQG